jgi:hypothetical protein
VYCVLRAGHDETNNPPMPHAGTKDARTGVAWTQAGSFFMVVVEGDDEAAPVATGWNAEDMGEFFRTELSRYMRVEKRRQGQFDVTDAVSLDGGGSTSFRFIGLLKHGEYDQGRAVKSVVHGWAPP